MTRFDLDTQGFAELQGDLEELAQKGDGDAVYKVEVGAEYAVHIEFGRGPIEAPEGSAIPIETESGETIFRKRVSGHPPYPFFRPAIREFQANTEDFILDNTNYNSIEEIPNANALVQAAASSLESQMKTNATAQSSGRSPGTNRSHPDVETGNLRASISATRLR